MKKLAIAAAMAAFTTAASAQNVSVYGFIDQGFQQYDAGDQKISRMQDSLYQTSRLGFKATEDLGAGLKANMQLEGAVSASSGTLGSTSTTGNTFNREAYVGLSGNFGEVRLGTTDLSLASEMDSLVNRAGNFGLHAVPRTSVEGGADQKNVIRYISPEVAGFGLQIGGTNNGSGTTSDAGGEQQAVSLTFKKGALTAGAGYYQASGSGVAKKDSKTAALGYDFGVVFVGASYAEADNSTTADVKSTVSELRATMPLANGVKAHAIYAVGEDGSQASANKGTGYTLALTKDLSKRTSLYAAYTSVTNEANSAMYMNYQTTTPGTDGLDPKAISIGIAHQF